MRNIKELLQVMLDNQHLFTKGLCSWSSSLWFKDIINSKEDDLIYDFIQKNKPKGVKMYDYYWEQGDIAPRIEWIKIQLK